MLSITRSNNSAEILLTYLQRCLQRLLGLVGDGELWSTEDWLVDVLRPLELSLTLRFHKSLSRGTRKTWAAEPPPSTSSSNNENRIEMATNVLKIEVSRSRSWTRCNTWDRNWLLRCAWTLVQLGCAKSESSGFTSGYGCGWSSAVCSRAEQRSGSWRSMKTRDGNPKDERNTRAIVLPAPRGPASASQIKREKERRKWMRALEIEDDEEEWTVRRREKYM